MAIYAQERANAELKEVNTSIADLKERLMVAEDRIIIGVKTKLARAKLEVIYRSFIDKNIPIINKRTNDKLWN